MNARESTPRTRSLLAGRLSRILQAFPPKRLVGRVVAPIAKAGVFHIFSVVRHRSTNIVQSAAHRPPSTVHGSLIAAFPKHSAGRAVVLTKAGILILLTALWTPPASAAPVPTNKPATYPAWWFEQEVIKRTDPPAASPAWPTDYHASDDFAVLNQGQLKNLATKAYAELKDKFPGQPWTTIDTPAYKLEQLVLGWHLTYPNAPKTIGTDPFATVNQGQLKYVAHYFYDVLNTKGYTGGLGYPPDFPSSPWPTGALYPWSDSQNLPDSYAVANLGQAKRLFCFDASLLPNDDEDGDGLPDSWEQQIVDANPNDNIQSVWDVLPNDDFDHDGLNNLGEYQNQTTPTAADSDTDGLSDGHEVANGLDPLANDTTGDKDGDGVPNNQDARPNDPNVGVLTILINTPANGATY